MDKHVNISRLINLTQELKKIDVAMQSYDIP